MNKFAKEEEIIQNFIKIQREMDLLIKDSKIKLEYFAEILGLKRTQFYYKRKRGEFTAEELKIIFKEIEKVS